MRKPVKYSKNKIIAIKIGTTNSTTLDIQIRICKFTGLPQYHK
ncbi:hypothetical protein HSIVP1_1157 [Veillonella parvula HSIVP1]|nr:hypothetical protein HMPREF1035_0081 [Veillonella parvula ATCC 17745]EGL76812.1 hypothetical protein HMPREF9323_0871 [Veillonella parvula ACS-068-V-Sch12]EQC67395.1 hypothetical protein HSIVP1_1157 [Veillonella parvula HSIVP1]